MSDFRINGEIKRISDFFDKIVFGWMYNDVNATIDGDANFLAALGLMEYTEILGGMVVTEKLIKNGITVKEFPKECRKNFEAFLPYLGECYEKTDKNLKGGLYGRVRCGLAHEYFIKGSAEIHRDYKDYIDCGIIWEKEKDRIHFYVKNYFEDFKKAAESFYTKLVDEVELIEEGYKEEIKGLFTFGDTLRNISSP